MLSDERRWRERHAEAVAREPRIRIDGVEISAVDGGRRYAVVIFGFNLHAAISPPRVTVGGLDLEAMTFSPDGRTIGGILPSPPGNQRVVVDFGFARAELDPSDSDRLR